MIVNKFPFPVDSLGPVSSTLNNNSWETISKVSKAGLGDTYWDIGDCKAVKLNGKIGDYCTLSNKTLYVFILDFNHPINKTTADNNIIWGGFKTALTNGVDVALVDSGYGSAKTSGKYFNMNHRQVNPTVGNSTYGGWKGCDFRYDILGATSTPPSPYNSTGKSTSTVGYDATQSTISSPVSNTLMAALPSDFRSVLRLWHRYIDYKGNKSKADENCSTPTIDGISLLSVFEVYGSDYLSNPYENDHQKQMAYYANGNSITRYDYNSPTSKCRWFLSSPSTDVKSFCIITDYSMAFVLNCAIPAGVAPAFRT